MDYITEFNQADRLVGWKRIAAYLNCSERTARRWESEEDLPVHRQQHETRSTIYAFPAELDGWIASRATGETIELTPHPSHRKVATASIYLIIMVTVLSLSVVLMQLNQNDRASAQSPITADPIALDLYERGVALWQQRGEQLNDRAIKLLSEAVDRDANFAEAWAALASAWLTYPTYSSVIDSSDALKNAILAADRAIGLKPSLTEPRSVMASIAQQQRQWLRAEEIFKDASEADPDNSTLVLWLAGFYRELGLMQRAEALTDKASKIAPNSPPIMTEVAMNKFHNGDVESALQQLDYLWFKIGLETPVVWVGRWFSLIAVADYKSAQKWIEKTPFNPYRDEFAAFVAYKQQPNSEKSKQFAERIKQAYQQGLPAWLAYFMLDQADATEAALEILDQETAKGFFDISVILFYESDGRTRQTTLFADYLERLDFRQIWQHHGSPDICTSEPDLPFCIRLQKR